MIEEIAQAAGVAVPTVYATYGGKRALLVTLLDEMESIADSASLTAALSGHTPTAPKRLRAFIDFSVRLFTDGSDLIRIAELAGLADPDVAALWELGESRRIQTCREVVATFGPGTLRTGLSPDRAADILWAASGPEFHSLFVRKRQWPPEVFANWRYQLAAKQLLNPRPAAES